MFCASLRRRNSFTRIVPQLSSGLSLKGTLISSQQTHFCTNDGRLENQLSTHDLCIPIPTLPGRHGRDLRLLLLSPGSMLGTSMSQTLERIQHFSSITGGIDTAIVFLLESRQAFVSARQVSSTVAGTSSSEGAHSYAKLQAELIQMPEASSTPILPLANLDDLCMFVKTYLHGLGRVTPKAASTTRSVDLLPFCSADPPLSQFAVNITTDTFQSLSDLATTIAHANRRRSQDTNEEPAQWLSSDETTRADDGDLARLAMIREQVGDDVLNGMIEFWADEWVVE